ncbi:MAG: Gfo/Idh/MocA family protein [Pyrinomonadaceae bacterium]
MTKLRIGLIGCGRIAQLVHLPLLTRLPDIELAAVAEPDVARRQQASRHAPRATAYATYEELLDNASVEAVLISSPPAFHAEAAIAALRAGKHVYLEKPLATNLREGRALLDIWRRTKLVGMIGFNYRFNPMHATARRYIAEQRLGALIGARSVFSAAARTLPEWKQRRDSGGGVLLDLASHHIDLVRFFFGQEIGQVSAQVRSQRSEHDSATLELRLADGLPVQSFFTMSALDEDRFEFYGTAGKLTVDRLLSRTIEVTDAARRMIELKRLQSAFASLLHNPPLAGKLNKRNSEPSFQRAVVQFVAAVRHQQPASPDFEDGYRSLAVVAAAEESARTGRAVSVSQFEDEAAAR